MQVQEIMTQKVDACHPTDTMDRAVQIMLGRDCGCVPVVDDDGRVVGIITDRDICLASHAVGKRLSDLRVADGMAPNVECCAAEDSVAQATRKLQARQVRRLPVIDAHRRLVGIVTVADLARATERRKEKVSDAELSHTLAAITRPTLAISAR